MFIAPILQFSSAPLIYLNLSEILVPSGRFSCRNRESYHNLVYYFITRARATRLCKRKLPSRFIEVLSIVSRKMRRPIIMTLVPTPIINLDLPLLLLLQLQGCTTAKTHSIGPYSKYQLVKYT